MDKISQEHRSENMRSIRSENMKPVPTLRDDSPQARWGFTVADQVEPDLSQPAKRTPISGLHGADDGAVQLCPAPTPATGFEYKPVRTARTRST